MGDAPEMIDIPFAEIVASAPVGVIVFCRQLVCRYANGYALAFMGQAAEEVIGRPAGEVLPRLGYSDVDGTTAVCRSVIETGEPIHRQAWRHPGRAGLMDRSSDWSLRRFVTPSGVVGLVLTLSDVTPHVETRRRAEQAEAAAEAERVKLAAVLQQLPSGVSMVEAPSGKLIYHNEEAVRLLRHPMGVAQDYAVYGSYGAVHADGRPYLPEDYPTVRALLHGVAITNEEMHYRRGDGTMTYLSVSAAPIRGADGRITGAVSSFHDISERKRIELSLGEANRELEQFAFIASHDLQEPLRMIASYLGLLSRKHGDQLDEKARSWLDEAVEGAGRMNRLIKHLLDFARIDRAQLTLAPVDSGQLVDEALRTLAAGAEERRATVTHADLPVVQADAPHLARLFQNLIGNAIKYTPPDRDPVIVVSARPEGTQWLFSVADNGIGIAAENRQRVFALFERLHSRDEYPGTGIGLAICKKIVDRHGGRIWVESAPGEGSTFRFTLPDGTGLLKP